ncbi:hypothetical protein PU630_16725 [Microbacterium horticulturae]|uniref:Uncharacterized protein n=1 Tax=Microbacterium horticulturae TaxID=3028316 RepID=A0ABY8C1Y8_9MICO|nr:hypothetical protein [Microbacterium sp. KACC 23027]WEG08863.1 hypothetical protein PU630_16725 [Microbacterium sp. KACC 23027]
MVYVDEILYRARTSRLLLRTFEKGAKSQLDELASYASVQPLHVAIARLIHYPT